MKDETQVKDEIILVVKEAIRDNTTLAAVDWEPAELDSDDVDNIAEEIADKLCPLIAEAEKQERRAEIAERALFDFYKRMLAIPSFMLALNGVNGLLITAQEDIEHEEKNND